MIIFMVVGSAIQLNFFLLNDYGIQIIFYFVFLNNQVAWTFLTATIFSKTKTATGTACLAPKNGRPGYMLQSLSDQGRSPKLGGEGAPFFIELPSAEIALERWPPFPAEGVSPRVLCAVCGYLYVFGSGLLGQFLLRFFLEDATFNGTGIFFLEWIPCFALYRGLYEFAQAAFIGNYQDENGMTWSDLSNSQNGLVTALLILLIEWAVFLLLGFYLDQVRGPCRTRLWSLRHD